MVGTEGKTMLKCAGLKIYHTSTNISDDSMGMLQLSVLFQTTPMLSRQGTFRLILSLGCPFLSFDQFSQSSCW